MNTTPVITEVFDSPEEISGFVNRALFRAPEWRFFQTTGAKFTHHTMDFRGPNWFGWIQIVIIGEQWRDESINGGYYVKSFVRRTDGPMFMVSVEDSEIICRIRHEIDPKTLYPLIEAGLDEVSVELRNVTVSTKADLELLNTKLAFAVLPYLRGAGVTPTSQTEAIDFSPEDVADVANAGMAAFVCGEWKEHTNHRGTVYTLDFRYAFFEPEDPEDTDHCGRVRVEVRPENYAVGVGYSSGSYYDRYGTAPERHSKDIPGPFNTALLPKMREALIAYLMGHLKAMTEPSDENRATEGAFNSVMSVFPKTESIDFSDEEMAQFAQVAVDASLVADWTSQNVGINNRFIDVYIAEIRVPSGEGDAPVSGYVACFQGSEQPWIIQSILHAAGNRNQRDIIGYVYTRPTQQLLDKIRRATLDAVKQLMTDEQPWIYPQNLASEIHKHVVRAIQNEPEVLSLNIKETLEPEDPEVDAFVKSFLRTDGIDPWKFNTIGWKDKDVGKQRTCQFKFHHIGGLVSFNDWTMDDGDYVQELALHMWDSQTGEKFDRSWASCKSWHAMFQVPPQDLDKVPEAITTWLADKLKPIAVKGRARGVLPFFKSTISYSLLNVMRPWMPSLREGVEPKERVWPRPTRAVCEARPAFNVQGLNFRTESRGAHHGQADLTLVAEWGERPVGYVDYTVFGEDVYVQYIHTPPKYRRKGIATAIMKRLQAEYPRQEIHIGGTTELGTKFFDKLERDFQANPDYARVKAAYDQAKVELAALQKMFDEYEGPPMSQNPELLKQGERFNELDDLIFDLEDQLRDLKPGTWNIRESTDWSEDEIAQFVQKAILVTVDWTHGPAHREAMDATADEWIMHVHAPLGHLSEKNNYIKMMFWPVREDGVQEVTLTGHFAAPVWHRSVLGGPKDFINHYNHLDIHTPFVIRPEDAPALRQAVEATFRKTIGVAIDHTGDPKSFRLPNLSTNVKSAFTRLSRKLWVKGKVYGLVDPETIVKWSEVHGGLG